MVLRRWYQSWYCNYIARIHRKQSGCQYLANEIGANIVRVNNHHKPGILSFLLSQNIASCILNLSTGSIK